MKQNPCTQVVQGYAIVATQCVNVLMEIRTGSCVNREETGRSQKASFSKSGKPQRGEKNWDFREVVRNLVWLEEDYLWGMGGNEVEKHRG